MASSSHRGRSRALVAVALLLFTPAADAVPIALKIDRIIRRSALAATTSVSILYPNSKLLYARAPNVPRIPASNQKLITTVAALDYLGPEFRFPTRFMAAAPPVDGVVEGDLYLVGGGDPRFATRGRSLRGWRDSATVERLARRLRRAGVREVRGRIVADGTRFDGVRGGRGWKPGFLGFECSPLSALAIDGGLTVRGIPSFSPEIRAARVMRRELKKAGVGIRGRAVTGRAPEQAVLLAQVESPPVRRLLAEMNKASDNFIAETLMKDVGAWAGLDGSTARGATLALEALALRGIPTGGMAIVDGSGLSADDRVTTGSLVQLIQAADRDPRIAAVFHDSLAVAGIDGTLRLRMTTGPARGRVHAKTGTLNTASSLSGLVDGGIAFAIIVNGSPSVNTWQAHALQDEIAQALAAEGARLSSQP